MTSKTTARQRASPALEMTSMPPDSPAMRSGAYLSNICIRVAVRVAAASA